MRSIVRVVVACGLAALCTAARAQQAQQGSKEAQGPKKGACKADAEKLCKDVQPGGGKMIECLKQHQADLSPACSSNMKAVRQELKKVSDACEPDVERYCFDTPMGKGGIASCLKKHSNELSADCKTAVSKAKGKAAAAK